METLNLVLLGVIVYFALVVIPNIWDNIISNN